jgi:hypothetical protein
MFSVGREIVAAGYVKEGTFKFEVEGEGRDRVIRKGKRREYSDI